MYQEEKVSVNWFKIGLRLVVVILIIFLAVKVILMIRDNKTNVVENNVMKEKIKLLEDASKKYFNDDNLPKESGSSVTVTLQELIDNKLIEEIKDEKGATCDFNASNIKVTRLDKEYQYKATLKCNDFEDYNNTFISIEEEESTSVPVSTTSTPQTTKKITTTKRTTTKVSKKYTVSFNTNGGSLIEDQLVKENHLIISPGVPKRDGYKFVGWFYHGDAFDMSTKINQDYVLTAKWVKE